MSISSDFICAHGFAYVSTFGHVCQEMIDAGGVRSIPARRCAEVLEGPKVGRLVTWRRECKRLAAPDSDRCWQHRLDRNEIYRARRGGSA